MRTRKCNFRTIEDQFNFGRYCDLSLADVLDINPSYLDWCVKHCTGVLFMLHDSVIDEIKTLYPEFIMDSLFEQKRIENLNQYRNALDNGIYYDNKINEYCSFYEDSHSYSKYSGSWAQEVEGYSDDDIDTIFDGDPSAYWNID